MREVLDHYAKAHKGEIFFCASTVKEGFGARLGEFLGIS